MDAISTEERLRRFMLAVTGFILLGTIVELVFAEHYEEALQWVPFILSGFGLITVAYARFNPGQTSLTVLRCVMGLLVLGSLVGVYVHFNDNLDFVKEVHPEYSFSEALWPALTGGDPIMAPGILYLAGVLGLGATYKHPAFDK